MIEWNNTDINNLKFFLKEGFTHEEIGECLGRTKSSIMHKVQRLKLSKSFNDWSTLSKTSVLELIKEHKNAEVFDCKENGLPGYKTCLRILEVPTWAEARKLAGVPNTKTAKWDKNKPTIFYIIELEDEDSTIFRKFGVTQRDVCVRYSGLQNYKIIIQKITYLEQALRLEKLFDNITNKYKPLTRAMYKEGHGGHTECYLKGVT